MTRVDVTERTEVSVIIPGYNSGRYIDETLRSARAQTLTSIEIIVVDDGSTDDTVDIAKRHASDPRVRVISQANAGIASVRNHGIRVARAPWIALLDADDVALPERLDRQIAFLERHPDLALLGTHGWRIGSEGHELGVIDLGPLSPEHFTKLRESGEAIYLLPSSAMFKRDIVMSLGGFRGSAGVADDVDLWTRMADHNLILTLPERLVRYRVHAMSASSQRFFLQMEEALRVGENAIRWRSGRPEIDVMTFHQMLASGSRFERIRRCLEWRSKYSYRKAGGLLADRRWSGLWWLARSFLLWPAVPIDRLHRQVWPWFLARSRHIR